MLVKSSLELDHFKPWVAFRTKLECSRDPLIEVARYFEHQPKVKFYTDPYDQTSWPTAWELILENRYCAVNIILGICYTLQLTERFKHISPTINIAIDKKDKTVYYLLIIEDKVYGYQIEEWCTLDQLPKSLIMEKMYSMKPLQ